MTSSKPTKVGSFQKQKEKMVKKQNTVSTHKPLKAVRRYINEQEGKDVFEYSVFGSPNQTIGNFTGQKKLGDFNA